MYKTLKPIAFRGKRYRINEEIEDGIVDKRRASGLIRNGYITEVCEEANCVVKNVEVLSVPLPVVKNGESVDFDVSIEDVRFLLFLLQSNQEEAIHTVATLEKEEMLILINAIDQRKKVKMAAEERAIALKENRSDA